MTILNSFWNDQGNKLATRYLSDKLSKDFSTFGSNSNVYVHNIFISIHQSEIQPSNSHDFLWLKVNHIFCTDNIAGSEYTFKKY